MHLVNHEIATLERFYSGLSAELTEIGIERLEAPESHAIAILQDRGLSKMLIDKASGGDGADPLEFVRMQTALGRLAPSLAIASCMHHYKIAALASEAQSNAQAGRIYSRLVQNKRLLMASGGAEGKLGQKLYKPGVSLSGSKDHLVLNGIKRPCSLSHSMTHLSGMATGSDQSPFPGELMHFFIEADQPNIRRQSFWKNPVLSATQSHEVILEDAVVDADMLLPLGTASQASSFAHGCYGWFELSACAAYTGVLSALIEMVAKLAKPMDADLGRWAIAFGSLQDLMGNVAGQLQKQPFDAELLSQMFRVRFTVEKIIAETAVDCFSFLGGIGFALTTLPMCLMNICLALQFHPPRKHSLISNLGNEMMSGELQLA